MRYCVYISKSVFDTEITKIKKMIKSQTIHPNFDIKYKLANDQKSCYAFVKETNKEPCDYILKAMLYI